MAPFLPVRAISRSQAVRIGGVNLSKEVTPGGGLPTVYVDLNPSATNNKPRAYTALKELKNHLAIGAVIPVGPLTFTSSNWAIVSGISTTGAEEASGEFSVTTTAGTIRQRSTGNEVVETELKAIKKLSAVAGKERIDIITVSTETGGAAKYTAGTAGLVGKAVLPKTTAELEAAHELLVAEVVFTESKTKITVRNVNRA